VGRAHRAIGWGLWLSFLYFAGLVLVAFTTDGFYTVLHADADWYECNDCLPFMMAGSWFWAKVVMLGYTAAWAAWIVHRLRRRQRRTATEGSTVDVLG
jgi:hypothetical protein